MKKHLQKPEFVILSAELATNSEAANTMATRNLVSCLVDLGLKYKIVTGCYKGSKEVSFMVMTPCEETFETVKDLGLKSFNQESILFRDYTGDVALYYNNGDYEQLGTFTQVSEEEAENVDAFTKVGNAFWIVK